VPKEGSSVLAREWQCRSTGPEDWSGRPTQGPCWLSCFLLYLAAGLLGALHANEVTEHDPLGEMWGQEPPLACGEHLVGSQGPAPVRPQDLQAWWEAAVEELLLPLGVHPLAPAGRGCALNNSHGERGGPQRCDRGWIWWAGMCSHCLRQDSISCTLCRYDKLWEVPICYPAHGCHNAQLIRAQAARGIRSMLKLIPSASMCSDMAEHLLPMSANLQADCPTHVL
jgi:hypothetical protein